MNVGNEAHRSAGGAELAAFAKVLRSPRFLSFFFSLFLCESASNAKAKWTRRSLVLRRKQVRSWKEKTSLAIPASLFGGESEDASAEPVNYLQRTACPKFLLLGCTALVRVVRSLVLVGQLCLFRMYRF